MAHRQYTSCAEPGNYSDLGFSYLGWVGTITTLITFIVVAIALSWTKAIVPAGIAAVTVLISFLVWWLQVRLICLGGEKCAIGMVLSRTQPQPLQKAGDDDATMNVLLAPGPTDLSAPKETYWQTVPQGYLVKENSSILGIGRGYVQDDDHLRYVKAIHCEFEGSGINNLLSWAQVVLALLIASLLVPFPASLILALLALLFTLLAGGIGLFDPLNPGDPADINPNLGTLKAGDIIVVKGDWVYDSLHDGWNELHAVHDCQIIGSMTESGPWPSDLGNGLGLDTLDKVNAAIDSWCSAIQKANEAEEGGSRDDPGNDWVVHPLVDGCKKPIIIL